MLLNLPFGKPATTDWLKAPRFISMEAALARRNEFHRKKDEGNSLEPSRERARIYGVGQELPNPKGGRRTINN